MGRKIAGDDRLETIADEPVGIRHRQTENEPVEVNDANDSAGPPAFEQ